MQDPIKNTTTPTSPDNDPTPKKGRINYSAAISVGLKDVDIFKKATEENLDVFFPTKEKFAEIYKDIPDYPVDEMYEESKNSYLQYQNRNFNAFESAFPLLPNTPEARRYVGGGKESEKYFYPTGVSKVMGSQAFQSFGNIEMPVLHEQQIASNAPYIIDINGDFKPISELYNYDYRYEIVENINKDPRLPEYVWMQKSGSEYGDPNKMLSIFGPKQLVSNGGVGGTLGRWGRGLWGSIIGDSEVALGYIIDALGEYGKAKQFGIAYYAVPEAFDNLYWTDKTSNQLINSGHWNQLKHDDEAKGLFDNHVAFQYNIMNGIGQIVPIIASSGIGYAAGKGGASLGAKMFGREVATGLQAANRAAKTAAIAQKISYQSGMMAGVANSMGMYRQQMREMGVDDYTALKWSIPFGMATYASESIFGSNIVAGWFGKSMKGTFGKEIADMAKPFYKNVGTQTGKLVSELPEETQKQITKSFWKKVMDARGKINTWAESSKWAEIGIGAGQEALEEMPIEASMDWGIESLYNATTISRANDIVNDYGTNIYGQEPYSYTDDKGAVGYGGTNYYKVLPSGKKEIVRESQWKAEQEDLKNAKKIINDGEKLFKNPEKNFSLDQPVTAFISTAITLGLGAAIKKTGIFNSQQEKVEKGQKDNISNMAFQHVMNPTKYSRENIYVQLQDLQSKNKVFGRDFVTFDNEVLEDGDQRPSEAQTKINLIMDEFDTKVAAIKTHGLATPSAVSAMAGDDELINEATEIATKIEELEAQRQELTISDKKDELTKIEGELTKQKMELDKYIKPLNNVEGSISSKKQDKLVKIEGYKYFFEKQAHEFTEAQLVNEKDKTTVAYAEKYQKIFDATYKKFVRNADQIASGYKNYYDAFYQERMFGYYDAIKQKYVPGFKDYSREITNVYNENLKKYNEKYKDVSDLNVYSSEKIKEIEDFINNMSHANEKTLGDITPEHIENVKAVNNVLSELKTIRNTSTLNDNVNDSIDSLVKKFGDIINSYAISTDENGTSTGVFSDMITTAMDNEEKLSWDTLEDFGRVAEKIRTENEISNKDQLIYNALLGSIYDQNIEIRDETNKVINVTKFSNIINDNYQTALSEEDIQNPMEVLLQMKIVEDYLKRIKNYIDLNRNFFQDFLEKDPNKKDYSYLNEFPNARISKSNYENLNNAFKDLDNKIQKINEKLSGSVYVRDLQQTVIKVQNLEVRYEMMVFLRDIISQRIPDGIKLTDSQVQLMVEIDTILDKYKTANKNDNQFDAFYTIYKNEVSKKDSNPTDIAKMKKDIFTIEQHIVDIENECSGKLGKVLDWVYENYNNGEYFFRSKYSYTSFDEFYLNMPYAENNEHGGLMTKEGFNSRDSALGYVFRSNILPAWFARLNEMGRKDSNGNTITPSIKQIYAAYRDTEVDRHINAPLSNISNHEQETTLLHLVSHFFSPSLEHIDKLSKGLGKKDAANYRYFIPGAINVRGYAGAGKTTQVLRTSIPVIDKIRKQKDPNAKPLNILIINPTDANEVNHQNNEQFYNGIANIQYTLLRNIVDGSFMVDSNVDLIILDEGSTLSEQAIVGGEINGKKLKGLKNIFTNKTPFWVLSDDTQPASVDSDGNVEKIQQLPVSYIGEKTVPMTEIRRNGILTFHTLLSFYRKNRFAKDAGIFFGDNMPPVTYNYDKETKKNVGARYRDNVDEIIENFIKYVTNDEHPKASPDEVILILPSEKDKSDLLEARKELLPFSSNIKVLPYNMFDPSSFVGGIKSDNVFFAVDLSQYNTDGSSADCCTISRFGVVAVGRLGLYLEMIGPTSLDKCSQGVVIGADEALGKKKDTSLGLEKNLIREENIERLNLIVGDETITEPIEIDDRRSSELYKESNIILTEDQKNVFKNKSVDENDDFSVSNIVYKGVVSDDKDSKERNKVLRLAFEFEMAPEEMKEGIRTKLTSAIGKYREDLKDHPDKENLLKGFEYTILDSMDRGTFKSVLGSTETSFLFKNIGYKGSDGNTINGNPFMVRIVGMKQGVPIVDIYDISFKRANEGLNIISPGSQKKLGLYASIMMANGFKVNNLNVLNLQEKQFDNIPGFLLESNLMTLDDTLFETAVVYGNGYLKTKTDRVTIEELFINDRHNVHDTIKPGDVFIRNGELVSVEATTALYDGKGFVNHFWLQGFNNPFSYQDMMLMEKVDDLEGYDEENFLHKRSAQKFNANLVPSTTSVFYGLDIKNINHISDTKDLHNINTNNWLRVKHQIATNLLNKKANRVYYPELKGHDGTIYKHVITVELTDDMIDEIYEIQPTILSQIGIENIKDKEDFRNKFKIAGLHIISNEYKPEYTFKTKFTDEEISEFASMSDVAFEQALELKFASPITDSFVKDQYGPLLIGQASYKMRMLRYGINESKKQGNKPIVIGPTIINDIDNGTIVINSHKSKNPYNKVSVVANKELLSSHGITRGVEGFQLITVDADSLSKTKKTKLSKSSQVRKFVLRINRGLTGESKQEKIIAIAEEVVNDRTYLDNIIKEAEETQNVSEAFKIINEVESKGFTDENQDDIDKAKSELGKILNNLDIIKFAEANGRWLKTVNSDVFNKFFVENGKYVSIRGNLKNKFLMALSFAKNVRSALDAYDKAKTADNKKKYEWSTHVYKHVFAGTVYDKGHIIEENLVTRFIDLHEKNFYTAVDKNFVNPNIVVPKQNTKEETIVEPDGLDSDDAEFNKLSSESLEHLETSTLNNAKETLIGLMGKKNIEGKDSKLWFNKELLYKGDKLVLGRVKDGLLMLADLGGMVEKYSPRHEAAHYILLYMVNDQQRNKILKSAKERLMADKNYLNEKSIVGEPSLTDIHEYIADLFQNKSYLASNKKTTLLNRFIDWIKRILARVNIVGNRMENFLYSVDAGYYIDRPLMNLGSDESYDRDVDSPKLTSAEMTRKLYDIFGDENTLKIVVNNVLLPLWKKNSPITTELDQYTPTLADSIYATRINFMEKRRVIDEHKTKTIVREFINGKQTNIYNDLISGMSKDIFLKTITETGSVINRRAFLRYIQYHLGDPEICNALLKRLFPSMDIEKLFDLAVKSIVENSTISGKAMLRVDNELSNPTKSRSILLSSMMATIKLRDYKTGYQIGRNYVNEKNLATIFSNVIDYLREQGIPVKYENILEVFYDRMKKRTVQPNEKNIIFSFLSVYGNRSSVSVVYNDTLDTSDVIARDIVETFNENTGGINKEIVDVELPIGYYLENPEIFMEKIQNIEHHAKYSEISDIVKLRIRKLDQFQEMINAIYSYYRSNKTSFVVNDQYSKNTGIKSISYESNNVAMAKEEIKDDMSRKLTTDGHLKSFVYDAIMSDRRIYTINDKGVFIKSSIEGLDEPMITRTVDKDGKELSFEADPKDLQSLASGFLGIYRLTGDIIDTMNVNELAKLVYMMMLSLKVTAGMEDTFKIMADEMENKEGTEENQYEDLAISEYEVIDKFKSNEQNQIEHDIIEQFYKERNYVKENVSERENKKHESSHILSSIRTFMPMDMYSDLNHLADKLSWNTFDVQSSFYLTVEGEKAYSNTLGHFFSDLWNMGSESAVKRFEKDLEQRKERVKSPVVSFEKGEKKYNNALLNKLISFEHIKNYGGINGEWKSAAYMRMSMKDTFMSIIENAWNSILYSTNDVTLPTMSYAYADKSYMPMMMVKYANAESIIKVTRPRGGKIAVNTQIHVLVPIIDQIVKYYEQQRINAYNDFKTLLGYSGANTVEELQSFLENIKERDDLGMAMIHDLTDKYHYVYDRNNDKFYVGNAIKTELSEFKEGFAQEWNNLKTEKEKYNYLKSTFSDQYLHFINEMNQSGYELKDEIKMLFTKFEVKKEVGESEFDTLKNVDAIREYAISLKGIFESIYTKLKAGKESLTPEEFQRLLDIPKEGLTEEYMSVIKAIEEGKVLTERQLKDLYKGIKKEKNRLDKDIRKKANVLKNKMSSEYMQVKDDGSQEWHPLLEGLFWNFYIVNESMQQLDRGSANMNSDVTDFVKRSAGLIAPRTVTNIYDKSGIGDNMRVLVMEDIAGGNDLLGSHYNWKRMTDGFSLMNPVSWLLIKKSAGGEAGIFTNGAIKTVNYHYDPITNIKTYFKFSQTPVIHEFMSSKYYQSMMAMMLNAKRKGSDRTLWDRYKDQLLKDISTFNIAIEKIAQEVVMYPELREQMVDYVIHESDYKSGLTGKTLFNLIDKNGKSTFDNIEFDPSFNTKAINTPVESYGVQTYLLQDTDETEKALATQILALIGVNDANSQFVDNINRALAGFTNIGIEKLKALKTPEKRAQFLKDITLSKALSQGESAKYLTLLSSAGYENEVMEDKLFSNIVNFINNYVRPDMPGQSYVQMPNYMRYYFKNGKPYNAKDLNIIEKDVDEFEQPIDKMVSLKSDDVEIPGYELRMLKPTTYEYRTEVSPEERNENGEIVKQAVNKFVGFYNTVDATGNIVESAKSKLIKMLKEKPKSVIYKPAEVVSSFNYMKKFGLTVDMTMTDATVLKVKNRKINMYDGRIGNYKMVLSDFRNILNKEYKDIEVNDIYASMHENIQKEIKRRLLISKGNYQAVAEKNDKEIKEELLAFKNTAEFKDPSNVAENTKILEAKYADLVNQYILKDRELLIDTIAQYYNNFNLALDVYFVRIPTSNASSGGMGRIVAFSPSSKNVFYISPEQDILSDADFDGDPIQVFYRALDENGEVIRKVDKIFDKKGNLVEKRNEKAFYQNLIFDSIEQFYSDVDNSVQVLAKIDINSFRKRVEAIKEVAYVNNLGSHVKVANNNKQGKRVVGFFSNQNTLTAKLRHIPYNVRINNNIFDNSLNIIFDNNQALQAVDFITKLLQGAVDNANEGGMLGKLNVNEVTSPLISGLTLMGLQTNDFKEKMSIDDTKNYIEQFVMDRISTDPLVRYASDETLKSLTVTSKRKYIWDVFDSMIKNFDNKKHSVEWLYKEYGVEVISDEEIEKLKEYNEKALTTPEVILTKDYQKLSNKITRETIISNLKMYKKYSLVGEQLRRFTNIPKIQQEFTNSKPMLHKLKVDIEIAMGMSIDYFLNNLEEIKANTKLDVAQQIDWLSKTHMKYSMDKEKAIDESLNDQNNEDIEGSTNENEKVIRGAFSISKVVAHSPNLVSYIKALKAITDFSDTSFKTAALDQPLYENILRVTGKDRLTYENEWKSFYNLKKDIINAFFLHDRYTKFDLNLKGNNHPFGQRTSFNLGNIKDRVDFVMFMPNYIRQLKDQYSDNKFIQQMKFNSTKDGIEYIEFRNNLNMEADEKTMMQEDFNKLAKIDPSAAKILRVYQFITYGFKYKNGSYSEMTDTVLEAEFSDWVRTFDVSRILNPNIIDEILRSAAPAYPELVGVKKNIDNGATIYKQFSKDEIDPLMFIYSGSGGFTSENFDALTNPAPRWMNSVTLDSSYTNLPVIRGIEINDLVNLRYGITNEVKIKNWKYKFLKKDAYDKYVEKRLSNSDYYNKFLLYNGAIAITVDGTPVRVYQGTYKSDMVIKPLDEKGEHLKASGVSYNNRKDAADVVKIITDRLIKVFPFIKVKYVNNDTAEHPQLLGYISNGVVYLNVDRMENGTPFHEIVGHIFVDYLEQNNKGIFNQLRQQAEDLINNPDAKIRRILNSPEYKNLSKEDLVKEVIATIVGWTSDDVISDHFAAYGIELKPDEKNTLWNSIRDVVRQFYAWVKNTIEKRFGIKFKDNTVIDKLSSRDLTIEGFSKIITEHVINENGPIKSYTSESYAKLQGDEIRKMAKIVNDINKDTKINTLKDFITLLSNTTRESFDQMSVDNKVKYLKVVLSNSNNQILNGYYTGGKSVDFNNIKSEVQKDKMLREIAEDYTKSGLSLPGKILDYYNKGKGNIHNSKEIFGLSAFDDRDPKYSNAILQKLSAQIGYNPSMKAYKYSWLKSNEKYSHLYNDSLDSDNVLVFIEETNDGKTFISLYDISSESITITPEHSKLNLFNFMYSDNEAKISGVSLDNTIGNIKALSLSVISQYMNSKVKGNTYIKDAGVIQLNPGGVYEYWVDPVKHIKNLKILANEKRFTSMLNNDVFKNIFDSNKLKTVNVDYMSLLISNYENMDFDDRPYYINDYLKMKDITIEDTIKLFKTRLIKLLGEAPDKGKLESKYTSLSIDEVKEIEMLMEVLLAYGKTPILETSLSSNNAINDFDMWMKTGYDYDNEIIKRLRSKMMDASNKIVIEFNDNFKQKWFNQIVLDYKKDYQKNVDPLSVGKQVFKEYSSDYYKDIFVKVKTKDSENNDVMSNNGYILWTKDAKEDRLHAHLAKDVSDEVLSRNRKIVEAVTDMYTKLILHKRQMAGVFIYKDKSGNKKTYDYERARWELLNETAYNPGMMPIMNKTVGELFSSGHLGAAWRKKFVSITDTYMMFDDLAGMDKGDKDRLDRLQDSFLCQIGMNNPGNTIYGSSARLSILGLTQDIDGVWHTEDVKKNNNMSMDLETSISYFMMSGLRVINYESDVLPLMNAAKIYFHDYGINKNIDTTNLNKLVDLIIEGSIQSKRRVIGGNLDKLKIDPAISTFQSTFGTIALFGNLGVGVMSGLVNGMKGFVEGIANSMVKNGLPTGIHITKASTLFFTDYAKVTQLVHMFQVANMGENDLLTSRRHIKNKKHIWSEHIGHWFNWSTDMYARSVMMVAQMLADGSYDAYTFNKTTGEIEYDETKDNQWNVKDAQVLKDNMKKNLIAEGLMKTEDKKLTRGYDLKSMRKFKALGDKYIVGAYDDKTKGMLGQVIIGRMAGMFHTYLVTMIQNAFQEETPIDELGKYVVTYDNEGKATAAWERHYVKGYIVTIMDCFRILSNYVKTGRSDLKLKKVDKYNIAKVTTMIAMFLLVQILYGLLVDEGDDSDDDDDLIKENMFTKKFTQAAWGLFAIPNMLEMIKEPWAAAGMTERIFKNKYGQYGVDNLVNALPGTSSYKLIFGDNKEEKE